MKEKYRTIGKGKNKWKICYLLIEKKDLPKVSFEHVKRFICLLAGHKEIQFGGVGTFVDVEGYEFRKGNVGNYVEICQRCGKVRSYGITWI